MFVKNVYSFACKDMDLGVRFKYLHMKTGYENHHRNPALVVVALDHNALFRLFRNRVRSIQLQRRNAVPIHARRATNDCNATCSTSHSK